MEKFYASKTFLKMAGGKMHTPHPTLLAISYRTEQAFTYVQHFQKQT